MPGSPCNRKMVSGLVRISVAACFKVTDLPNLTSDISNSPDVPNICYVSAVEKTNTRIPTHIYSIPQSYIYVKFSAMLCPELLELGNQLVSHVLALKQYPNEGKVVCIGTFEEVRKNVPEFDNQAKLMGL